MGASFVQASAYKCTTSTGKITYSDTPCPNAAAKDEKFLGRGAGSNPLSVSEKAAFTKAMMSKCTGPHNVCFCLSGVMADSLTYEEVLQAGTPGNRDSPAIVEKALRAKAICEKMAASQ